VLLHSGDRSALLEVIYLRSASFARLTLLYAPDWSDGARRGRASILAVSGQGVELDLCAAAELDAVGHRR
jgi:hypothetical protein